MKIRNTANVRVAELAKLTRSRKGIVALQQHVEEIVEGTAFKGSQRSGQFLRHIVHQAVTGDVESLKERVIGIELFGRSPTYDTGDDAIVRVTASDVRKRLLQHYGIYGSSSGFRLSLPSGAYVPEIIWERREEEQAPPALNDTGKESPYFKADSVGKDSESSQETQEAVILSPSPEGNHGEVIASPSPQEEKATSWAAWHYFGIWAVALISVFSLALFCLRGLPSLTTTRGHGGYPWTALFTSSHKTYLILSDPDIAEVQDITGTNISASDYANHNYYPGASNVAPDINKFVRLALQGNKVASVDVSIALSIMKISEAMSEGLEVYRARDINLANLRSNDSFIVIGSPRSNPWVYLYDNELDFKFTLDKSKQQEYISNVHLRPHELLSYIPNAGGLATGQSFATIAFIPNPERTGKVLLLAGTTAEGTEAAAQFATDLQRLTVALQKCGVTPQPPNQYFEILLSVKSMAGAPTNADVAACHVLQKIPE